MCVCCNLGSQQVKLMRLSSVRVCACVTYVRIHLVYDEDAVAYDLSLVQMVRAQQDRPVCNSKPVDQVGWSHAYHSHTRTPLTHTYASLL